MPYLNRFTAPLTDYDTFHVVNDFAVFATGTLGWTSLAADVGATVAAGSTRSGVVVLTTGGTDNNEAAVYTTNAPWLAIANKPIYGRFTAQYSEANTSAANVLLGFASSPGANLLVDDGGGVRTSGSIIAVYKIDGGTVWRCHTRNGSSSTDTVSTTTAGGSAYSQIEIEARDYDGVNMQVEFRVDGVVLKDTNGLPIRHYMPISGAAQMSAIGYIKAGSGTSEVLNVDHIYAAQLR